ncbi:MAG: DUF4157 domain-containing protein, partial [Myxococcales bacterium]|nr:DUF4157 domain-containing protein [Myxococcales bacterium]
MARNAGLSRKTMADGGEVFQGALASRALKAVGARAMTMDGNIFVNEGFGGTPEDQALYAHEKVHEEGSGGHDHGDHNRGNDPEEMAARAVERMVLHKARSGEDLGETLSKIRENMPRNQDEAEKQIRHALSADKDGEMREQAMMGYWAIRSQGLSEKDVNRMLSEYVQETM